MEMKRTLLVAAGTAVVALSLTGCVFTPLISDAFYKDGTVTTPEPRDFVNGPNNRTVTPSPAPETAEPEPDTPEPPAPEPTQPETDE